MKKKILHTRLYEFFSLWKNYSFSYAFYNIIWWFCFYIRPIFCYDLSTFAIKKKTKWLDKYIENNYQHIIDKYNKKDITKLTTDTPIKEPIIWFFWGQGEENMPHLVRACYKQLTYYNKNVKLITNKNLDSFIKLPKIIYKKVEQGNISWANYSDIIRNTLLMTYGGLWLDATVWVSGKIPFEKLIHLEIFSANGKIEPTMRAVRFWTSFEHNWSSWCLWSRRKKNPLYSFVSDMMIAISEKEKMLPDYVIQDYLIYYAACHFPIVNTMLERMRCIKCNKRNSFASIMNEEYNENKYKELIKDEFLFKLSYRAMWQEKTKENKITFYGNIIKGM